MITQVISPSNEFSNSTSQSYIGGIPIGAVRLDRSKYDGNVRAFFEPVGNTVYTGSQVEGGIYEGTWRLYDETNGAEICTIGFIDHADYYLQSKEFTDYWNAHPNIVVSCYYKAIANMTCYFNAWHIRIIQTGIIHKTRTIIGLGHNRNTTSTSYLEDTMKKWLLTTGNYDGSLSYMYSCVFRQSSGNAVTAYADLYDVTAASEVTGSQVTNATTTFTYNEVSGLSLTTGHEYSFRRKVDATGAVHATVGLLYIDQDAGAAQITKTETMLQIDYRLMLSSALLATKCYNWYHASGYLNSTVAAVMEYAGGSASTGLTATFDGLEDGNSITGASVSTTTGAYYRFRSGALTLPTGDNNVLDNTLQESPFSAALSVGRIILTITNIKNDFMHYPIEPIKIWRKNSFEAF